MCAMVRGLVIIRQASVTVSQRNSQGLTAHIAAALSTQRQMVSNVMDMAIVFKDSMSVVNGLAFASARMAGQANNAMNTTVLRPKPYQPYHHLSGLLLTQPLKVHTLRTRENTSSWAQRAIRRAGKVAWAMPAIRGEWILDWEAILWAR